VLALWNDQIWQIWWIRSKDSSVSIVTRLWVGKLRNCGFISSVEKGLCLLHCINITSRVNPTLYSMGKRARLLYVKQLEYKPDLLPLFSTEVKNVWTIHPLLHSASWFSLSRGQIIYLYLSESVTVVIIWKPRTLIMLCCTTLVFSVMYRCVISVYLLLLPKIFHHATFSLEKNIGDSLKIPIWKCIKSHRVASLWMLGRLKKILKWIWKRSRMGMLRTVANI
jgi:hypothetical protein